MKALRSIALVAGIASGAALLASCAPVEPTVLVANQEAPAAFLSPPPAPADAYADAGFRKLMENPPASVVGGDRLNVELLTRFYARHGFAPVWTTRQVQADLLVKAILNAGDHGLSPELFRASLLRSRATLPPAERELLLSSAFLAYADALARGAMPIERRKDNELLKPEPVDVAAALDAAANSADPAAVIDGLAPNTPTYRLLRQSLRTATTGLREIEVNLERERWLPRRLPESRVWVNVADGRVVLFREDRPVFSTRVIVGQDDRRNQSPEFQTTMDGIIFNPPWNIPADIAKDEILPMALRDPTYLARHNMVRLPDGGVQQLAGAGSALGHLMFQMPNQFDVYLHDTPSKDLFGRDNRRISHGCIRVENPRELAALLMQQPIDAVNQAIAAGTTIRSELPRPVPVFIVYQTAFADADGRLQFRADVYGRDAEIAQYLKKRPTVAIARAAGAGGVSGWR